MSAPPAHPRAARRRRPAGWGRVLSPRQVKAIIAYEQLWEDRDGTRWQVSSIWRHQGAALLTHHGVRKIRGFRVLGRDFHLIEDGS